MFPPLPNPNAPRESYTQQVSLKIGISLEQKFLRLAQMRATHVNNIFREALAQFVANPQDTHSTAPELLSRLQALEAENQQLRQLIPAPLSAEQIAYDAFCNPTVIEAIRDIAQRVENADIDLDAEAILHQFMTFIPQIP